MRNLFTNIYSRLKGFINFNTPIAPQPQEEFTLPAHLLHIVGGQTNFNAVLAHLDPQQIAAVLHSLQIPNLITFNITRDKLIKSGIFDTHVAKQNSIKEITKNSKVVCALHNNKQSLFYKLPPELCIEIAGMTGDLKVHDEQECRNSAYKI